MSYCGFPAGIDIQREQVKKNTVEDNQNNLLNNNNSSNTFRAAEMNEIHPKQERTVYNNQTTRRRLVWGKQDHNNGTLMNINLIKNKF